MNTKIQELKDLIKAKAEYQVKLKENRKTVNFKGEERLKYTYKNYVNGKYVDEVRDMNHYTAAELVRQERHELRMLYAAYGLLRGKSFSKTESGHPEENHPLNEFKSEIMKIVNTYQDEKTVCTD
jgi:hypothetical protein